MARRTLSLTVSLVLVLLSVSPAPGQEWPRFRGPNGSGVSPATTVPVHWTDKDCAWKVALAGAGHSSPVLWGERVFVTSADEETGKRVVECLRAGDGGRLWSRDFPGPRHGKHPDNSFASATPAADGRRVYVCWANPQEYLVVAVDHDGKEAWRADLGPYRSGHGFGASPIVCGDLLIVPDDQDGPSTLVALDCATGQVRWKVPRRSKATYTTPCLYEPPGLPSELIVSSYEHGISGLDPKTGRTLWEADVFHKGHLETAIGSPVVAGDLVLGTCGWLGVRQEVIAVRAGESREVYHLDRAAPLCTTPLVKDDLLFLWSDGGIVTCADVRTGAVYWRDRVPGSYYASPVCAGDHLYGVSRDGDVIVLAAAKKFEMLARNPLGEGSHSTPAIAGGRLYVRTFTHLFCVGGKKSE
jgi:outer membrane protein assembly factor BamB